nr:membrane-bound O-acyltransferase family protein [Synergistaceae bacterium]
MVFSSTVFLFLFLPGLLLVYYLPSLIFKKDFRAYKNFVLLMSSLFFYAWGEPAFVFVMLISVLFNWLMALLIENFRARKFWLIVAVNFNILLLFVFKYASFVSRNLALLTGNEKLVINILLPVGISFFTFQMMSYVFDVYYKISRAQKNPLYTALYITLFPQLIAGPIVRYRDIEREILNRRETFEIFSSGVNEFIYGLAKKVLIANFMARIADNVFDYINNPSVLMAWLGAIAYMLQIYFDFSGYSDMAIGLGRMFGFNFNINF